tara:strand:- start:390 stop:737 length:348 start_codon:yes stop_codon:yes gene_type:complete
MFICEICGTTHNNDNSELCNVCFKNSKAAKKEVTEKHADSKLKLADLISKARRLISSQEYAINKHSNDIDVTESKAVVKMASELFTGKATKAKLLALITANSNASRSVNNQLNNK